MRMVDESDVMEALKNNLLNEPEITAMLGVRSKSIPINEPINDNYAYCPWLGIYYIGTQTVPNTTGKGWKHNMEVSIVAQSSDPQDPKRCMKTLTKLVKHCVEVLTGDTKVGGTVDFVKEIGVDYTNTEKDRDNTFLQVALINIALEVRANAR